MNEYDEERVFMKTDEESHLQAVNSQQMNAVKAQLEFKNFLQTYQMQNEFIYLDQIRTNYRLRKYCILVRMEHLIASNSLLADAFRIDPATLLPIVCFLHTSCCCWMPFNCSFVTVMAPIIFLGGNWTVLQFWHFTIQKYLIVHFVHCMN